MSLEGGQGMGKKTVGEWVFLCGPSGSGKSTLGKALAQELEYPFIDLDQEIQSAAGKSIEQIFADEGEAGFRLLEAQTLAAVCRGPQAVVALGGGALLDSANRCLVEGLGAVLCLEAPYDVLLQRLYSDPLQRPLLQGGADVKLKNLLQARAEHYASFPLRLDTSGGHLSELAWRAQRLLGMFRIRGMGAAYDVRVIPGGLSQLGALLQVRGIKGPLALVSDDHVAKFHLEAALAALRVVGYAVETVLLPPGEEWKTIQTVARLWQGFVDARLERGSSVVALGGGVVGDLAGFAAATYLRGVSWVAVPTSLLAMVDASLGGKTGADLPQGKNLIGAFHAPRLVLADPDLLQTLPLAELRNGLAEVIKHGVIGDPELLEIANGLWISGGVGTGGEGVLAAVPAGAGERSKSGDAAIIAHSLSSGLTELRADLKSDDWNRLVRRAMAVKIRIIQEDPFEAGARASLNLGHTLGHAIELVSGFQIRHGEAVGIGMLAATRAAQRMGIAGQEVLPAIQRALEIAGLPLHIPDGLDEQALFEALSRDKKRAAGVVRFVLPEKIGKVRWGVELADYELLLESNKDGRLMEKPVIRVGPLDSVVD